jgi:hypothetical protein
VSEYATDFTLLTLLTFFLVLLIFTFTLLTLKFAYSVYWTHRSLKNGLKAYEAQNRVGEDQKVMGDFPLRSPL